MREMNTRRGRAVSDLRNTSSTSSIATAAGPVRAALPPLPLPPVPSIPASRAEPAATQTGSLRPRASNWDNDGPTGKTSLDLLLAYMGIGDNNLLIHGAIPGCRKKDERIKCVNWMQAQGGAVRTTDQLGKRLRNMRASWNKADKWRMGTSKGKGQCVYNEAEQERPGDTKALQSARIDSAKDYIHRGCVACFTYYYEFDRYFREVDGGTATLRQGTSTGGDITLETLENTQEVAVDSLIEGEGDEIDEGVVSDDGMERARSRDQYSPNSSLANSGHSIADTPNNSTGQSDRTPSTASQPSITPSLSSRGTHCQSRQNDIASSHVSGIVDIKGQLLEMGQAKKEDRQAALALKRKRLAINEGKARRDEKRQMYQAVGKAVNRRLARQPKLDYEATYAAETKRYKDMMAEDNGSDQEEERSAAEV